MNTLFTRREGGYTLLFSVLVSSLVLAVGISILTTSRKEFLMATSTRDSAEAFYAADAGLECALLNEGVGLFQETSGGYPDYLSTFACNLKRSPTLTHIDSGTTDTFTFHVRLGDEGASCAVVTVKKSPSTSGGIKTEITSFGYNTGWSIDSVNPNRGTCSLGSAKRVERALLYTTS